jgi:glyoxylase-like metal-dependent hydrolase (beta-lactamase superfamily II)
MKSPLARWIVGFVTLGFAAMAQAQAPAGAPAAPPGPPPPMQVKEVKPGVYMITGNGGNSTVRVGKDAVILVDTKNPGDAIYNELMEKIRGVSPLPVKYVFITHHHNDHAGNIVSFLPTAKVVAAKELPPLVQRYTPANNARKPSEPNTTYNKKYSAKVKDARVQAFHFARAHTGGDTIVYFPDVRVVSVGDELVAATPNVDYPFEGSVLGWQKSMAALLKLKFDVAIPGHGDNPMSRLEVEAYAKKWDTFIERARAEIKAGTPKEQLMAKIKTDDLGWNVTTANWTQPARLDPFYAELSQ